ncbi:hybrid sensor histidine kinase/response regulator [Noviherbaspirillum aerium]|uniref:hybrid sensor histidine kinase/response regulator n=1 Tax=Noviherbaspirillum aerium TaxID=2588497 RepID=UPI001CEF7EAE|nr:ATP-binding protein [Noviherbaspirillum aerium]
MEQRILILAPTGKDARLVSQVFDRAGLTCFVCSPAVDILAELDKGAGALFIVDEALTVDFLKSFTQFLNQQQTWSDLPVIVLSKRGLDAQGMRKIYQELGNVTILERPVQSITLLTAANAALRARKRQYEMREIDRRKDEFLAMLAHELRNPLAPISAAAELLKMVDLDPDRMKKTSDIISRQVEHMTGLIDDLLDVSRVSRGLVELDQGLVDARKIVANAVEQVRPLIDLRRHHLSVHTPPVSALVQGDQKRLIQIISNLLNNAAKYTLEGGTITLTMEVDSKNIVLSVTDNGIGMAPEVIEHVFEMFTQAERTPDRSQGGLGIGLSLVKSLVELHHGSVKATSPGIGKGSTFSVLLPRAMAPGNASEHDEPRMMSPSPRRQRLLVVDDNVDAARMLGMFLESAGHEIMIEHSARNALERARKDLPDVCLLDIGLPDMDGNELARCLRAQAQTKNLTLIAITGYGQEQDRRNTADAGFLHHFVKPVDMERLLAILATPVSLQ